MSEMSSPFVAGLSRRRFLSLSAVTALGVATFSRLAPSVAAESVTTTDTGVFFDPSEIHIISMSFDQSDYDAMIDAYVSTGDKEWIAATVTIDGSTYEQVGLRLKGNSSLMGLRGTGGNGANQGTLPPLPEATPAAGDATPTTDRAVFIGGGGDISADTPESLPWLVRLDRNIDDQNHEGLSEFVIRSNNSQTSLNEAVALDLLAEAGLASQRAAYATLTVNDSGQVLRLAIENPRDAWMAANFSADGLLFKSEAEGDWSYRGDSADSYKDIFDLEAGDTGDDQADFEPLIEWLDFLNNSDDETFVAELPTRLDLPQFATYLAMMDLIQNQDDIDGPGNNSYLYSAPETHQFTVVPWDMNLAFGGMGGGMDRVFRDGSGPSPDQQGGPVPPSGTPTAGDAPQWWQSDDPSATSIAPGEAGEGQIFRTGGIENPLTRRFAEVEEFTTLLDETSTSLRSALYEGGTADGILDRWVGVLQAGATELVDSATITSEADSIRAVFTEA